MNSPSPQYASGPADGAAYGQRTTGTAGGAWTPPLKPGLVPLRPLSFGLLLGAPFQVLRRNPRATFGSAILIQLVILIVTGLLIAGGVVFTLSRVTQATTADRAQILGGSIVVFLVVGLVSAALAVLGTALLQALLVIEVSREVLGEKRTFGFLWRVAWKRFAPLLGYLGLVIAAMLVLAAIIVGIVVLLTLAGKTGLIIGIPLAILGGLGLAVLGAWLYTRLAFVPCAIVLERKSVRASIARSWSLTRGSFWKTFGVLFLVNAILWVASQIVATPVSFLFSFGVALIDPTGTSTSSTGTSIVLAIVLYAITTLISLVFGAISAIVQAGAIVLLYIDLRMRREGLDLELVRYVESGGSAGPLPDPFDPAPAR